MSDAAASHNLFRGMDGLSFRDAGAAVIQFDDGRYLVQHRDDKPGIFYPDHWGLFGGAVDPGEDTETALRRELKEELGYDAQQLKFFMRMIFAFDASGNGGTARDYYECLLPSAALLGMRLGEGQSLQALLLPELLLNRQVVPYDLFALWTHHARGQQRASASFAMQN